MQLLVSYYVEKEFEMHSINQQYGISTDSIVSPVGSAALVTPHKREYKQAFVDTHRWKYFSQKIALRNDRMEVYITASLTSDPCA